MAYLYEFIIYYKSGKGIVPWIKRNTLFFFDINLCNQPSHQPILFIDTALVTPAENYSDPPAKPVGFTGKFSPHYKYQYLFLTW